MSFIGKFADIRIDVIVVEGVYHFSIIDVDVYKRQAEDFSNVAGTFAAFDPQLVLMDVNLPFFNGYHWCSEIRKVSKVPVIFVSSASDNMNIVMAVSMGGRCV